MLDVQRTVADQSLRTALGDWISTPAAAECASLVRAAAEGRQLGGRPLYAGLSALAWPDRSDPHLTIWHGFTLLREFRGDCHNAVLVAHDIDPCECHLLMAAGAVGGCECHRGFSALGITVDVDTAPSPNVVTDREWPVADRKEALKRLCERGILREDGTITSEGAELHHEIECQTDKVATSTIDHDHNGVERLAGLLEEPVSLLRQDWTLTDYNVPANS